MVATSLVTVTNGDKYILLSENETKYISTDVVHSLENPGKFLLESVKVQSVGFLGEDNIVSLRINTEGYNSGLLF